MGMTVTVTARTKTQVRANARESAGFTEFLQHQMIKASTSTVASKFPIRGVVKVESTEPLPPVYSLYAAMAFLNCPSQPGRMICDPTSRTSMVTRKERTNSLRLRQSRTAQRNSQGIIRITNCGFMVAAAKKIPAGIS